MSDIDLNDEAVQAAIEKAADERAQELAGDVEAKIAEATEGLKSKNQQLLSEVKRFKQKVQGVPEDFDPEEWERIKAERAKAEEDRAKEEGRWEEYKQELVDQHKEREAAVAQERDQFRSQLENVLIDNAIIGAISKAKGNAELLQPHVRRHVKLFEDDGKLNARVVDQSGNPRIAGAEGDYMTIEGLLEEFKKSDTYAPCFEGSRATGSGAGGNGNGSGGAVKNPFARDTLNLTEQARLKRDDPEAAARLQKAAAGG